LTNFWSFNTVNYYQFWATLFYNQICSFETPKFVKSHIFFKLFTVGVKTVAICKVRLHRHVYDG